MEYSKLGSSSLSVSRVCLGTMTFGQQVSEEISHEMMDYSVEQGINFFDTAELYSVPTEPRLYGRTEEIIGTWFAKRKKRDDIILASKIAGPSLPYIRGGSVLNRAHISEAIDSSLKRMQTDYMDLYQLHWPHRASPHFGRNRAGLITFKEPQSVVEDDHFLEILRALNDSVKAGKIRYIGLSDDSAWGIMKYLELAKINSLPRMVSIQNEFSLLNRSDDPYVAEVCVREDVAYLPWSPLAAGLISGKYKNGARPEGSRWALEDSLPRRMTPFRDTPQSHKAVEGYLELAKKHSLDVCQMALKFCDVQPFVTSTIIGATTMDQLKIDIEGFKISLSDEVLAGIDKVYTETPIPF